MLESDFIGCIDRCIEEDLPFALYRLPKSREVVLLLSQSDVDVSGFDDLKDKGEGFVLHPFKYSNENPIYYIKADKVLSLSVDDIPYSDMVSEIKYEEAFQNPDLKDINREEYLIRIKSIVDRINKGELEKLVFSKTKTIGSYRKLDLRNLFFKMEENYKDAFVSLVNIPDAFSWCGASPEMLLGGDNSEWKTVALAGTQKYNGGDIDDIEWGEKEIKEQAFVCNHIEKNIVDAGFPFDKTDTKTVRAAGVVHIETEYNIKGDSREFWELVNVLHPTPAICGTPKEKALKLIEEFEENDRTYYSGFLGPVGIRSQRKLFVNLRCARWKDNEFSLFVGGGITGGSIPEKEWEETELKADTLIKLI